MHPRFVSRCLLVGTVIALSLTAADARAVVILDTFDPGDTATGLQFVLESIPGQPGFSPQALALPLTTASAVTIDSILAAISGAGDVALGIMTDSSGLPSKSYLASTVLTDPAANVSLTGLGWALGPRNYWLAAVPAIGCPASSILPSRIDSLVFLPDGGRCLK